jgi:hypothetical protein
MNYNPSGDSVNTTQSGQAVVEPESDRLNPSLQQALSCLDIKLEDELNRFRQTQQEPDLNPSVQAIAEDREPQLQPIDDRADEVILTGEIVTPEMLHTTIKADDDSAPQSGGFVIIDEISTLEISRGEITTITYAPLTVHGKDLSNSQSLDINFSRGGEIAPFHEEYLGSSQELLRQIQSGADSAPDAPEDRPQPAPTPSKGRFLTPLKIGAIAAACVIAGGGVYTYLNPSILAPLTATKVDPIATTSPNSLGQLIQSPNLAANEFTELNLSTINTIKMPTAAPITTISTSPPAIVNLTGNAPVAIPFNGTTPQTIPPTAQILQPRLSDSLVDSLLPSNFRTLAKQSQRQPKSGK